MGVSWQRHEPDERVSVGDMTIEELLVDKQPMLAWLGEKHPFDTVGISQTSVDCPVARFVRERLGVVAPAYVAVLPNCVAITNVGEVVTVAPKPWVGKFIARVDRKHGGLLVIASEAWDILDNEVES